MTEVGFDIRTVVEPSRETRSPGPGPPGVASAGVNFLPQGRSGETCVIICI